MSAPGIGPRGLPAFLMARPSPRGAGATVLAILCSAAAIAVLLGDHILRGGGTVGALGALPVLVASWFLSRRWALVITVLALLLRVVALALGDVTAVTCTSECIVIMVLAVASSVAATSVVAMAGDITERHRVESALADALAEAEAASHAKSEYLSRASHELRTPLTVILGFAGLLEMEKPRPEQQAAISTILKAGDHLMRMIDELLEISRIESGREVLSLEPVRIDEVLADSLELVALAAAQRRVAVHHELSTGGGELVIADGQRLMQVVLNLLTNAVKYNREGGHVDVRVRRVEGERVRLSVKDTGPGIAPELMHRLFQPFDRLGAERTTIQGTGLGLALSKRLVDLMCGTIGVDTEPGAGSSFWVEFPRAAAIRHGARHARSGGFTAATSERVEATTQTVLYVEDNLASLELIERTLQHRPTLRMIPLMQGSLALELAAQHRPDLVLLDLHLPDIDGDQVLHRLKADERTRDIPVIMLGAEATDRHGPRLRDAGALAYLTKPIRVQELLGAIDDALADAPRGETHRPP